MREAREPRKKDTSRAKKRKNIDSCIKVTRRDPEVLEYSNLVEKRGVSGSPANYGSLLRHRRRIPAFRAAYHMIYVHTTCVLRGRASVLERSSVEMVK